jgi:hypothetical protein
MILTSIYWLLWELPLLRGMRSAGDASAPAAPIA